MINSQDIKNGVCIRMDGRLYFVIEFLHVKPGKGNTIMRVKFKDVVDGRVLERRFNIGEKLEDVRVERRPYQFLYKEGERGIHGRCSIGRNDRDHSVRRAADQGRTGGHVHRAGSEGRYRNQHVETGDAGDRSRDPRAAVYQRGRDRSRGYPRW